MGYSIYVSAPSEESMNKMFAFLDENLRDVLRKPPFDLNSIAGQLGKGLDLDYVSSDVSFPVGFNYSAWMSVEERLYRYRILEWMAEALGLDTYWYDSEEEVKITACSKAEVQRRMQKSGIGILEPKRTRKLVDRTFDEVKRLQKLWEESNGKR